MMNMTTKVVRITIYISTPLPSLCWIIHPMLLTPRRQWKYLIKDSDEKCENTNMFHSRVEIVFELFGKWFENSPRHPFPILNHPVPILSSLLRNMIIQSPLPSLCFNPPNVPKSNERWKHFTRTKTSKQEMWRGRDTSDNTFKCHWISYDHEIPCTTITWEAYISHG